jgi:hypothetical protein
MSKSITTEELRMVKQTLLLPLLLSVFDRDAKRIASVVKTPGPYVDALQRAMDRVAADLTEIRSSLRKNGVKVYEHERTAAGIRTEYQCRGYVGEYGILTDTLRAEAENLMRKYLTEDMAFYLHTDLPSPMNQL